MIPIHRLTDADRKWMLTAPNGGSGGRPIVTGMVVEEPDIEIGAGVSSKAISRRMQTDKGGAHGPKSTRNRGNHRDHDDPRDRGDDRGGAAYERGRDGGGGGAGGAPAFPFGMGSLPNGMPSFPSGGFQYQDQNGGQGGRWA